MVMAILVEHTMVPIATTMNMSMDWVTWTSVTG